MESADGWRKCALAGAIAVFVILVIEHLLPHGMDLNARDHWLSEYVLSHSITARWLMRFAFLALGVTAISVSMTFRERAPRALFQIASLALAAMSILDTDPNDGRPFRMSWPPTHGNLHQVALYIAIGATLAGMAFALGRLRPSSGQGFLLIVAIGATMIQALLVTISQVQGGMTHFGGVTERIVVGAMLLWVLGPDQSKEARYMLCRTRKA